MVELKDGQFFVDGKPFFMNSGEIHYFRIPPKLWKHYFNKLSPAWAVKVEIATKDRIALSHTAGYNGKGRHMALGTW